MYSNKITSMFINSLKSRKNLLILKGYNRITPRLYNTSYITNNSNKMADKSALVLIADGSEEMETIITVDVLRRAKIAVTLAGINGTQPVTCSRNVVVVPDISLNDAVKKGPYDAVVLPGGLGGAKTFCENPAVGALLKEQEKSGRIVAAICAAPTALKTHGISLGKKLTSYPAFKDELGKDYAYSEDIVVVDGTLITSRGPGTAFAFALKLVEVLTDTANLEAVKKGLLL